MITSLLMGWALAQTGPAADAPVSTDPTDPAEAPSPWQTSAALAALIDLAEEQGELHEARLLLTRYAKEPELSAEEQGWIARRELRLGFWVALDAGAGSQELLKRFIRPLWEREDLTAEDEAWLHIAEGLCDARDLLDADRPDWALSALLVLETQHALTPRQESAVLELRAEAVAPARATGCDCRVSALVGVQQRSWRPEDEADSTVRLPASGLSLQLERRKQPLAMGAQAVVLQPINLGAQAVVLEPTSLEDARPAPQLDLNAGLGWRSERLWARLGPGFASVVGPSYGDSSSTWRAYHFPYAHIHLGAELPVKRAGFHMLTLDVGGGPGLGAQSAQVGASLSREGQRWELELGADLRAAQAVFVKAPHTLHSDPVGSALRWSASATVGVRRGRER